MRSQTPLYARTFPKQRTIFAWGGASIRFRQVSGDWAAAHSSTENGGCGMTLTTALGRRRLSSDATGSDRLTSEWAVPNARRVNRSATGKPSCGQALWHTNTTLAPVLRARRATYQEERAVTGCHHWKTTASGDSRWIVLAAAAQVHGSHGTSWRLST